MFIIKRKIYFVQSLKIAVVLTNIFIQVISINFCYFYEHITSALLRLLRDFFFNSIFKLAE